MSTLPLLPTAVVAQAGFGAHDRQGAWAERPHDLSQLSRVASRQL